MIYLTGSIRRDLLGTRDDVGLLVSPRRGDVVDLLFCHWACDNDCFSTPAFNADRYLAFLDARRSVSISCLFATAPDVVGDATATLQRALPLLPRIRALGFRAALVAQDGLTDPPWDEFDCLFIGGSTAFKLSHQARDLAALAAGRGKWVHMGRVNSERRMRTAVMFGCDSVDGTYVKFAPTLNESRMLRWLDNMKRQPNLVFV